ncbi:hypothetical protein BDQ17DRAFT_1235735 [Cyathus striatus]|nr:hypothetical protein BDQ17DRAFT_1235735 [Cyathus striatus]
MTILVVGGTGKTGLKLARLLRAANIPLLITSRSGTAPESLPAVKFDWYDPSTFAAPFEKDPNIDKVYFIGPSGTVDIMPLVKPFIDLAHEKGVKKWVILSSAQSYRGGPWIGTVHQYVHDKGVVNVALRSSWFHENFTFQFIESIKKRDEIISNAEDGRIPFIAAQDIAQVAFDALTTNDYDYAEPFVVGPELFTYDDVAALLSDVLGRKITHRHVPVEEVAAFWQGYGVTEGFAAGLAGMEKGIANGAEEKAFIAEGGRTVKYVGKLKLRDYLEKNKDIWVPA